MDISSWFPHLYVSVEKRNSRQNMSYRDAITGKHQERDLDCRYLPGKGGGGGLTEAIFTPRLRFSDVFGRHFCCFLPEIDAKERFVQYTFRTVAKKSFLFPMTRGSQLLKTSEIFFQTRISATRGAILSPDIYIYMLCGLSYRGTLGESLF